MRARALGVRPVIAYSQVYVEQPESQPGASTVMGGEVMGMEVLDGREVEQGVQLREGECVRSLQRRCVVELDTLSEYQEPRHVDRPARNGSSPS